MKDKNWKKLGYAAELLGPGMGAWCKRFTNGCEIVITGSESDPEHDCTLPGEFGPYMIGMYDPPAETGDDLFAHMELSGDWDHSISDEFLVAILTAEETQVAARQPKGK